MPMTSNDAKQLPLDLQPYAAQVLSVCGAVASTDKLVYFSEEIWYSTCYFSNASGLIGPQTQQVFQQTVGQPGQGALAIASESQTNFTSNPISGNELFCGLTLQCDWQAITSSTDLTPILSGYVDVSAVGALPLTSHDIQALNTAFYITHSQGAGPTRQLGRIGDFPSAVGAFAGGMAAVSATTGNVLYEAVPQNSGPNAGARYMSGAPVFWSPNVKTILTIESKTPVQLLNTTSTILTACRLSVRGWRITLPV